MLVRRHALAENAQAGIAVAGLHVAKHLVVTAVFLDDVNDVLEHAGFADAFWHRHRRVVGTRRQLGLREQRITQIRQRLLRERGEFLF